MVRLGHIPCVHASRCGRFENYILLRGQGSDFRERSYRIRLRRIFWREVFVEHSRVEQSQETYEE